MDNILIPTLLKLVLHCSFVKYHFMATFCTFEVFVSKLTSNITIGKLAWQLPKLPKNMS